MKNSPYEPEVIDVREENGTPTAITTRRRTLKVHRVLNMWRIDEDWWRCPVSRLYLLLELQNGTRLTVFHDMIHHIWYRQNYGA
jgi:hypothetical protein